PGIHVYLRALRKRQTWMAGTSPAMTPRADSRSSEHALIAGVVHRSELAAAEKHHPGRKAAALLDPAPHALRIDIHQQLRGGFAGDRPAVVAGIPGRVETKPGPRSDANAFMRNDSKHHGAGRQ